MQCKLSSLLKSFIYDVQNKTETESSTIEPFTIVNNPTVTKCKGQPLKRFKSNVKVSLSKESKQVLKDSTQVNVTDNNVKETKEQKCENCKQYVWPLLKYKLK
jgi:hypothetical protein